MRRPHTLTLHLTPSPRMRGKDSLEAPLVLCLLSKSFIKHVNNNWLKLSLLLFFSFCDEKWSDASSGYSGASMNRVTFPCINSYAYFPVSANTFLAFFPQAGLANCGDARSPATSWQTQVLLFCGKRSLDYLRALGTCLLIIWSRLSLDH